MFYRRLQNMDWPSPSTAASGELGKHCGYSALYDSYCQVSKICKVKVFWFPYAIRFDIRHDDIKFFYTSATPRPKYWIRHCSGFLNNKRRMEEHIEILKI
ncbi:hypothetical protein AVEN_233234-1 [Araneus ventricosus]|uniref:Uncharacterized protein n=1 Tax=Araneus ventricosus TaxID=182803 RepID=A0A4Y2EIR7_ARAVE|nr:hypothetical protein AVEN_233234-1 [Araneus ventricosus]